jgi:hypothetical protein
MSQKKTILRKTDFQNPEKNLSHNFSKIFNKNDLLVSHQTYQSMRLNELSLKKIFRI